MKNIIIYNLVVKNHQYHIIKYQYQKYYKIKDIKNNIYTVQ